jgi:hypothetical protein
MAKALCYKAEWGLESLCLQFTYIEIATILSWELFGPALFAANDIGRDSIL